MLFIVLSAGNADLRITEFFSLKISQNLGEKRDMKQIISIGHGECHKVRIREL